MLTFSYFVLEFEVGFADLLGGLLSVYARRVNITITTNDNVSLKSIYTPYFISQHKTDKSAEIYIGDVSNGEVAVTNSKNLIIFQEKDILFSVELPPLSTPIGTIQSFSHSQFPKIPTQLPL